MKTVVLAVVGILLVREAGLGQAPNGAVAGVITDESGATITGAAIQVANTDTGQRREVTSGSDGAFSVTALPAGRYRVRAESRGFQTVMCVATVETGGTTTVNLQMRLGETTQIVMVDSATPQISYESHKVDGVITRRLIEDLPLNGRSFLQLAFLQPGVTVLPETLSQYNRQFTVSILGGPSGKTRITVDGASVIDYVTGGTSQNFSQEIVEEFQISTVNPDLSTGISGFGAINVVSRTGTNEHHGSGFFFFRDHNLGAFPGLSRAAMAADVPFARRQSGFHVGGPILRDRLFYFGGVEHNNQDGAVTATPVAPEFAHLGGVFASPYTGTQESLRLDWRASEQHAAFLRVSHDGNRSFGPGFSIAAPPPVAPLPSNWVRNKNWADAVTVGVTSSLRPTMVNDLRVSYTFWSNRNLHPTSQDCPGACIGLGAPQISVIGAGFDAGNTRNAPQGRNLRRYLLSDTLTWQRGAHRHKFGTEWEYQRGGGFYAFLEPAEITLYSPALVRAYNATVPGSMQIPIPQSFQSIQDVLTLPLAFWQTGIGSESQPAPYNAESARQSHTLRFYWQDTWRVHPRLTVNYGAAYNLQTNLLNHDLSKPAYLAPIFGEALAAPKVKRDAWSPSAGFSWNVRDDNRTVVRGGFGIYYDTHLWELRLIERAVLGPRGNGRFPIPGSLVPNPIAGIPGAPFGTPLEFRQNPTGFRGAHLMSILTPVRAQLQQTIGMPGNTDLSVRNINLFKTGSEIFAPDFGVAYVLHYNLGVQREILPNLVVTADFVYRQSIDETMRNVDYNRWNSVRGPEIRACASAAERLDPAALCSAGPIGVHTAAGRSAYRGVLLKVDKRFARGHMFTGSYALQEREGWNGIIDKDDWFASYGPQGARHILTVAGAVELPWKFQFAFLTSFMSREAFMPIIPSLDLDGDGSDFEPIPGAQFNAFNRGLNKDDLASLVAAFNQRAGQRTPRGQVIPAITLPGDFELGDNFFSQDIRISRAFGFRERWTLTVFGEGFNIFNVANLSGYSANLRDPLAFGRPSTRTTQVFGSGGPRALQLGLRVNY